MNRLAKMVGGVVAQIAGEAIEPTICDVVACVKLIVRVQTSVMIVGHPGREEQAGHHR